MGFILEKYSENAAGLVVSFQQTADSDVFCTADSVEAAMNGPPSWTETPGNRGFTGGRKFKSRLPEKRPTRVDE